MPLLRAIHTYFFVAIALAQVSPFGSFSRAALAEVSYAAPINPNTVVSARRLQVTPHLSADLAGGRIIPLGVGSGLTTIASTGDTAIVLALSDRGPNVSLGKRKGTKDPERVIFPVNRYTPLLYPFVIRGSGVLEDGAVLAQNPSEAFQIGKALKIGEPTPLLSENGAPLSGLPTALTEEIPVDSSLTKLPAAKPELAMDPEAVVYDRATNRVWVAEEYAPSIAAFDPHTWRIVERLTPGKGLPEILRDRAPNRGFEGLTLTPKGDLVAILQSPLTNPSTHLPESFVRLLIRSFPLSDRSGWQSYALAVPDNAEPDSYKIGELLALSNERFLVLESFKDRSGPKRYHLVALDLTDAKPIDSERIISNGIDLSSAINRRVVIDFADFSWGSGKIEGLTMLNDSRRLVVSKDNDFGIELVQEAHAGKKGGKKRRETRVTFKDTPTEILMLELPDVIQKIVFSNVR